MGIQKKGKYKVSRRRFGQPCGRYSKSVLKREKARFLKMAEKIRLYQTDKLQYSPYQLLRRQCFSHGLYNCQSIIKYIQSVKYRKGITVC